MFAVAAEQRPWEGHFWNYERKDGMWVPSAGDVGWYVGKEWHRVWEGAVVAFEGE